MAFKMKGMSFGEGTGYRSPQLMKKEAAMKMKKEAAMKMKKDSAMDLNYDSAMKMKDRKRKVAEVAKERESKTEQKQVNPVPGTKTKTVTKGPEGRTVTKTKVRKSDGAIVKKSKGPGGKSKRVIRKKKAEGLGREQRGSETLKPQSPMKKEDKMYGGDKTYSEAQKQSKGNMNDTIKKQRAYEKKKKAENPDWNKRDDNAWKARQNKINEYAGSKKRYEVKTGTQDDGSKVKQSNTTNLKGEDRSKTVIKSPTGDKSKVVETKNKEGNITSQKTVDKTVAGTEKFKKKYDEDGKLIRVRGYATGENKDAAKAEKKKMKAKAKANRKANRKA